MINSQLILHDETEYCNCFSDPTWPRMFSNKKLLDIESLLLLTHFDSSLVSVLSLFSLFFLCVCVCDVNELKNGCIFELNASKNDSLSSFYSFFFFAVDWHTQFSSTSNDLIITEKQKFTSNNHSAVFCVPNRVSPVQRECFAFIFVHIEFGIQSRGFFKTVINWDELFSDTISFCSVCVCCHIN